MQPIPSTAEMLAYKALNRSVDETWINWALDMLMAGFETENLVILAGITPFYNQFELKVLTDKVFDELNLDYSDADKAVKNYASFLIDQCLRGERNYISVLGILKDLCIELDYDKHLYDFYSLYFAKDDLLTSENQWYWDGADRSNIDRIIKEYFENWLLENPMS
jgi:hypothetical protein